MARQYYGLTIPRLFPWHQNTSSLFDRPPPSHDTSSVGYHVTQASFLRQLDFAVQGLWSTRHRAKYVDVKVLLMSWESDDLGVERECQCLESAFRDLYHFDTEYWKIPDRNAASEATIKVISFMKAGSNLDNLLIFYYAGHASPNLHHQGGLPIWLANRSSDSPRLDSSCIQPHLCQSDKDSPDVLLLYDSCHPANGHGSIRSSRTVIELLAACGFESIAAEVGRQSFTHSLIQELSDAARRSPPGISVLELNRRLVLRLSALAPEVLVDPENPDDPTSRPKIRTGTDGLPIFEYPASRTPFHCQLSLNDRPHAILLAPLPPRTLNDTPFINLSQPNSAFSHGEGSSSASEGGNKDGEGQLSRSGPRVDAILKVSLEESEFNETDFRDWLCAAPPAAKGIKILGALRSFSTLVLIQVPVDIWSMMIPSPAIAFVGFARGSQSTGAFLESPNVQSMKQQEMRHLNIGGPETTSEPDVRSLTGSSSDKHELYRVYADSAFEVGAIIETAWAELIGKKDSFHPSRGHYVLRTPIGNFHIENRLFMVFMKELNHCVCIPIMADGDKYQIQSEVRQRPQQVIYLDAQEDESELWIDQGNSSLGRIQAQLMGAHKLPQNAHLNYTALTTLEFRTPVKFIGNETTHSYQVSREATQEAANTYQVQEPPKTHQDAQP